MPTHLHETLIEMFRVRPVLAAEILDGQLHVPVPEFTEARLSPSDLTDVIPTEYRADAVVTLNDEHKTVLAVVIEVQLRKDNRKLHSWPAYVATLYARLHCPVALLVLCPDQAVADWSVAPIAIGPPGSVVTPVSLGPAQVPVVTDTDSARRHPELTILSALAHGTRPDPQPIFGAMLHAFDKIDLDHARLYYELVLSGLPPAAQRLLEDFMTTTGHQYRSDFAKGFFNSGRVEGRAEGLIEGRAQGKTEGKAEGIIEGLYEGMFRGKAEALLMVLRTRGVAVSDEHRALIAGCDEDAQLDTWLRRAVGAEKIQELGDEFAG
ncbi:hypothetical protein GCM10009827_035570 [Dactylosporangium maewongense]|uniref:Transposase n=1 Tax=Dactylosporangium maewongense TaxID=634393 RepID=A0ABP4L6T4_9ACTN